MGKCALCHGPKPVFKQLCVDCHIIKEWMRLHGRQRIIEELRLSISNNFMVLTTTFAVLHMI